MAGAFNSSRFGPPMTALCDICGKKRSDPKYSHIKCSKIRQQRPINPSTQRKFIGETQ